MIHGKEWKNTRTKLSPVFTSKKQKAVFNEMYNVGQKLIEKLNEGPTIELKELACCIAVNMISDGVLGFDGKAISDPKNDIFRSLAYMVR
jgi:cytochrome P450